MLLLLSEIFSAQLNNHPQGFFPPLLDSSETLIKNKQLPVLVMIIQSH